MDRGEFYIDVAHLENKKGQRETFTIKTPHRQIMALGTKFAVNVNENASGVLVTQGKVETTGIDRPLNAGEQLIAGEEKDPKIVAAPRSTENTCLVAPVDCEARFSACCQPMNMAVAS